MRVNFKKGNFTLDFFLNYANVRNYLQTKSFV